MPSPASTIGAAQTGTWPIGREATPWLRQLANLAIIGALATPALTGAAGSLRLLFPAAAFAAAALLLRGGRFSQYVTFCLWLFLLTPFIRRLVDLQAGWTVVNTLMLAPYGAAIFSLGVVPKLLLGKDDFRGRAGFLMVVLAATYGLVLAVFFGRAVSGVFDYLRWVVPPCFAAMIVLHREHHDDVRHDLKALLLLALPLLGFYGIYQYLYIPRWDAFWMVNSEMNSIGFPEPYQVRVFSTLNSPGSFAAFLLFALTLALSATTSARWVALGLGSAAFGLTLVRSAWLGFALALAALMAMAPGRVRAGIIVMAAAGAFSLPVLLVLPDVGPLLEQRLRSLTELSADASFDDRFSGYRQFVDELERNVMGQGLAVAGTYQSYADNGTPRTIDGGPIEIFLALGVIGGVIYLVGVLAVCALALIGNVTTDKGFIAGCRACMLANLFLLSSGTTTVGEIGFFCWLAIALSLAGSERSRSRQTEGGPALDRRAPA